MPVCLDIPNTPCVAAHGPAHSALLLSEAASHAESRPHRMATPHPTTQHNTTHHTIPHHTAAHNTIAHPTPPQAATDALVNTARVILAYPQLATGAHRRPQHHQQQPCDNDANGVSAPPSTRSSAVAAGGGGGSSSSHTGGGSSSTGGGSSHTGGWLVGGLPLWLGADAPLEAPPQPLGSYYGR